MKACAATDLALEGRCPGRKFQTKQLVHSGSRICRDTAGEVKDAIAADKIGVNLDHSLARTS